MHALAFLLGNVISTKISCGKFRKLLILYLYEYDVRNRGSYMSAHVLLNLLNKLRKRDKMRGLLSILSLFCNKFKFNNTGTQMIDSLYHMTLKVF